MSNEYDINLVKSQAKEIWKVLDYVRGASPISMYKSLAYFILLIRYLRYNLMDKFNLDLSQHYTARECCGEVIICSLNFGLINRDVYDFFENHILSMIDSLDSFNDRSLSFIFNSNLQLLDYNDIASLTISELDRLFSENENKSGGEFYTPNDLNKLVGKLGSRFNPQSVCDPFAGAGNSAFYFSNKKYKNIDTQEINTDAHFKILVSRVVNRIKGEDYLGNSLTNPKYQKKKYDLIVSFPPYGMKIPSDIREDIISRKNDRWIGLAIDLPKSRSDWFITLSMLQALNDNGKLIVSMTLGSLSRTGAEVRIRDFLVRNNMIEEVILLPTNIHYSTGIPTVLLVLNSGLNNSEVNGVKFIDASLLYKPARGRNILLDENIESIIDACCNDGRFSITKKYDEIKNEDFNLNPVIYVRKNLNINRVEVNNFRGYSEFEINFNSSLNVLVGENGAGKTSILEAIACGFGPFLTAMPDARGKLIKNSDIHVNNKGEKKTASISIDTNSNLSWDLVSKATNMPAPARIGTSALTQYAGDLIERNEPFPLIVYYGTNRALIPTSSKVSINPFEKESRGEGYDSALEARVNYGVIKNWFSKIEVDELRKRDEQKNYKFVHPAKKLVAQAVYQIVERARSLEFDKESNDVVISWENENNEIVKLTLEQLSDGYRNIVSLTIDLVRRAYLLNPQINDPLSITGIVLIDEIELHLHPRWQQKIVGDLITLFPNVQFIITTHSPQVLTTVKADTIRIVSAKNKEAKFLTGTTTYGAESFRVLEDVLGSTSRPQNIDIVMKLNDYTKLVESGRWDSQEALHLKKILYEWGGQTEIELQRLETEISIREFERNNEKNQ